MSNTTNALIGAEYEGQKVAIRGSPNYDVMMSSVQRAFKGLRLVSVHRISISSFLEELGGVYEVFEEIWEIVLPNLKHVTVLVDSAIPAPIAPESNSAVSNDDTGHKRKRESVSTPATRDGKLLEG
ncbi:hypothetical protein FRC07_004597 [Ceratobasidium sp. 392]|nr:hypothetical protein FRC07_004597 [Ceratobasidium sp. 392]